MIVCVIVFVSFIYGTDGHGFLLDPPQRSSLWRFYPENFPPNYNDNSLNCGGRLRQWNINGGKCGPCGDPYDDVRDHEDGGYFSSGFISRNYSSGALIIVTVRVTSNHRGWFEFKLCPRDYDRDSLEECFDKHVLEIDGGGSKYTVGRMSGDIEVKLRLPNGVTCTKCILQWKYNTGNSWECDDNGCCLGCGPQEQFYNCADIGIYETEEKYDSGEIPTSLDHIHLNRAEQISRPVVKDCKPAPIFKNVVGMKKWCNDTCPFCPKSHCICSYGK